MRRRKPWNDPVLAAIGGVDRGHTERVEPYYRDDLAFVHFAGFGGAAASVARPILALLDSHGVRPGASVLDVGCGAGAFTRALVEAGYNALGVDASPAMISLARNAVSGAEFICAPIEAAALPAVDAICSVGHVLNYLPSLADIERAVDRLRQALRPGGLLVFDVVTPEWAQARRSRGVAFREGDGWACIARPGPGGAPDRFDNVITTFVRDGSDRWRRGDEVHRLVLLEPDTVSHLLTARGWTEEPVPESLQTEVMGPGHLWFVAR